MSLLTFSYLPIPQKDPKTGEIIGEVCYPLVPLRIIYKHQLYRNPINCLLDSGAGRNLFPAFFGEKLGIKIKTGPTVVILGIGGIKILGFAHKIKMVVGNLSFETEIDFSYQQEVPLLGRTGFFDKFKRVTFKEKEKIVELEK